MRCVERVQNLRLWTKYVLRRGEVAEAAGDPHEQMLFHGADKVRWVQGATVRFRELNFDIDAIPDLHVSTCVPSPKLYNRCEHPAVRINTRLTRESQIC